MRRHNNYVAFDTGKPCRKRLTTVPKSLERKPITCVRLAGRINKVKNAVSEIRNVKTNVARLATKKKLRDCTYCRWQLYGKWADAFYSGAVDVAANSPSVPRLSVEVCTKVSVTA
jgi:hypothetical protein